MRRVDEVKIPRWINSDLSSCIQLHAFADASRRAMATALYSRMTNKNGEVSTHLLWAKTKLAPMRSLAPSAKPTARMTIPRLELRASLLAARLLNFVASTLDISLSNCYLWTDSQVVLHWVHADSPAGQELIDNYISHVRELTPNVTWCHVPTKDNPADPATRGMDILNLLKSSLWWKGPTWLKSSSNTWPPPWPTSTTLTTSTTYLTSELAPSDSSCLVTHVSSMPDSHPIDKFSSLSRLTRAVARCRRLLQFRIGASTALPLAPLNTIDLRQAFIVCARISQGQDFGPEIDRLRKGQTVRADSSLKSLAPMLDEDGVLRVGGRLRNSLLPYEEKHPIITSGRSHLGKLIIEWAHLRSLHGGFRLTIAYATQRAWLVGGRSRIKAFLRQCVVCAKTTARPMSQMMAPLPAVRVTPSRPFSRCGLDYAGPFQVLSAKGRGIRSTKGYVALFICFSIKAVHLELVGDLATKSFLGALTRFIGRRGRPQEIWSDNGTTFHGATSAEFGKQALNLPKLTFVVLLVHGNSSMRSSLHFS